MRRQRPIHVGRRDARAARLIVVLFMVVLFMAALFLGLGTRANDAVAADVPGKAAFDQYCGSCHEIGIGARNGEGPQLNGIMGRPAATRTGFAFSTALSHSAIVWTAESFDTFIANPRGAVPGTRMAVPGIGSDAERAAITAYVGRFWGDGTERP